MTNQERLVRSESILRRQNSGQLSKWEAAAEFDRLLDGETGDLHFYCDTTCMRDVIDGQDVMILPHRDSVPIGWSEAFAGTGCMDVGPPSGPWPGILPSNTGIITQGPRRGEIVTRDNAPSDAMPEAIAEFRKGAKVAQEHN